MPVHDWSAVADENTSIDGINIAEHCPAKNINNAIRSVMAALKNKCDALDDTDNTLRRGAVIGEVRWFAMSTPPEGWLACNGAEVLISDYPALYNAIGTLFLPKGVRDAPGMFFLPNLMGKVPWGSTSVGTVIEAGLPNITGMATGVVSDNVDQDRWPDTGCFFWGQYAYGHITAETAGTGKRDLRFSASRSSGIYGKSSTVQPPALCLLPCIRYK